MFIGISCRFHRIPWYFMWVFPGCLSPCNQAFKLQYIPPLKQSTDQVTNPFLCILLPYKEDSNLIALGLWFGIKIALSFHQNQTFEPYCKIKWMIAVSTFPFHLVAWYIEVSTFKHLLSCRRPTCFLESFLLTYQTIVIEFEEVSRFCWSWSQIPNLTLYCCCKSSMLYNSSSYLHVTYISTGKSLFSLQNRNAYALVQYFGEDPARCSFEQGWPSLTLNLQCLWNYN